MRLLPVFGVAGYLCLVALLGAADTGRSGAVPERSFRIKLRPFVVPPSPPSGLLISGRVNGGPPLRMLLDSGAQFLVLSRRSAAKSGCSGGTNFPLVGAGAAAAKTARSLRAETIEIDDFLARAVHVLVSDERLPDGVDGVLPLSLFAGLLIRLDLPAKSLDLYPYPEQMEHQTAEIAALQNNDLLFVKCRLNGAREGYFLLDTGASYNAISLRLAKELSSPDLLNAAVSLQGGTDAVAGHLTRTLTRLQVGTQELLPDPMVAVDLSLASRYHGLEVSGLIGFPALRNLVLTVNYRDGLIRMGPK